MASDALTMALQASLDADQCDGVGRDYPGAELAAAYEQFAEQGVQDSHTLARPALSVVPGCHAT